MGNTTGVGHDALGGVISGTVGSGVVVGQGVAVSVGSAVDVGNGVDGSVGVGSGVGAWIAMPPVTGAAMGMAGLGGGAVTINTPINTTAPNINAIWLIGCISPSVSLCMRASLILMTFVRRRGRVLEVVNFFAFF